VEPIVIAFSKMEDGKKIKTIVTQSGYSVRALCTTASQVLSICDDIKSGIVIHGFRFHDMLYEELRECLPDSVAMLLLASPSHWTHPAPSGCVYLPMPLKRGAQILSGAYIGCTLTPDSIYRLRTLVVPAVIILAVYIPVSLVCGWLIAKLFHREPREAMLSATPGGASDMALISADLGVESADLMVTQILRMVTVVLLFPQLVYHLCAALGQLPG